jgi:hypothetical protein
MSISKIGAHGATTSSTVQPTAAEATPKGPSRAPESSGPQSLRSTARARVDTGAGLARRTGSLALAAVGSMLMRTAEAGYQPAMGAAAAAGARHPRMESGDGSEQARAIGIALAVGAGVVGLVAVGCQVYKRCAGKNTADTAAAAPPVATPAGDQSPV